MHAYQQIFTSRAAHISWRQLLKNSKNSCMHYFHGSCFKKRNFAWHATFLILKISPKYYELFSYTLFKKSDFKSILWLIEDLYCFAILLLPKLIIWCIILSCHISCQMSGEIAKKVQWTQVRLEMLIFKIAKISLVSPLGMLKMNVLRVRNQ